MSKAATLLKGYVKRQLLGTYYLLQGKTNCELAHWDWYYHYLPIEVHREYYRKMYLAIGRVEESFFANKVVLDIGCGPCGSLSWLTGAKLAMGLDPLTDHYRKYGTDYGPMLMLKARAESIPLATSSVDIITTINALDHVDDLGLACREIRRVLRPGGYLIGSFNINRHKTPAEPSPLTTGELKEKLFAGWKELRWDIKPRPQINEPFAPYKYFFTDETPQRMEWQGPLVLWAHYKKPEDA